MPKRPQYRSSSKKSPAANPNVRLFRLPGLPEIHRGDDLSTQITNAARKARMHFENGDILVVAQKIVSKAEDRFVDVSTVTASARAEKLGADSARPAA